MNIKNLFKRLESSDEPNFVFNQEDYLTFLISLFNGYPSFDLIYNVNNTKGEYFVFDTINFKKHQNICLVILKISL